MDPRGATAGAGGRPTGAREERDDRLSAVLAMDLLVHVDNGSEKDSAARGLTGRICVLTSPSPSLLASLR